MASRTFLYSFKVWLTTVVFGPLLLWTFGYVYEVWSVTGSSLEWGGGSDLLITFMIMMAIGLAICTPSLLIFWLQAFYVCDRGRSLTWKRLLFILLAFPLTFLPMLLIGGWSDIWMPEAAYFAVAIIGILVYRPPNSDPAENFTVE